MRVLLNVLEHLVLQDCHYGYLIDIVDPLKHGESLVQALFRLSQDNYQLRGALFQHGLSLFRHDGGDGLLVLACQGGLHIRFVSLHPEEALLLEDASHQALEV